MVMSLVVSLMVSLMVSLVVSPGKFIRGTSGGHLFPLAKVRVIPKGAILQLGMPGTGG